MMRNGKEPIHVIGLDCDDPSALEKFLRRNPDFLKGVDMICGGKPILDKLRHDPELSGKLLQLTPPLEPLFESIISLNNQGLKVAVLADGDPLLFGIGSSLVKRLSGQSLVVKPAISAVQAAAARINLPWDDLRIISMHGRKDLTSLFNAIGLGKAICIFTGGAYRPDDLARLLLDRGVDWYEIHVFERMGAWDEKHTALPLKDASRSFFRDGSTVILLPVKKPRLPRLGLDERRFRGAYSTKKPVRGAILELLQIEPTNTVWDVGAGSGVLSLEACALAHAGRVIAIEENYERCLDIQENRRVLGAINLDVRCGAAPECLDGLPDPQRIFMGGGFSGENVLKILETCVKSLPRGGRFVASCILLDSFVICRRFMEYLGWPLEMQQVQASNAIPMGPGKHFSPLNPIFLLATQKP